MILGTSQVSTKPTLKNYVQHHRITVRQQLHVERETDIFNPNKDLSSVKKQILCNLNIIYLSSNIAPPPKKNPSHHSVPKQFFNSFRVFSHNKLHQPLKL